MELLAVLLVLTIVVEIIIVLVVRRLSIRTGAAIARSSQLFTKAGEGLKLVNEQVLDLQDRAATLEDLQEQMGKDVGMLAGDISDVKEEVGDCKLDIIGLQNAVNVTRPLEAAAPATSAQTRRNSTNRKKVSNTHEQ